MIFDLTFYICAGLFLLVAGFFTSAFYVSLDVERARAKALAHPETIRKAWFEECAEEGHLYLQVEFADGTEHQVAGPFPFHINNVYGHLKDANVPVENVPEPLLHGAQLEYLSVDDEVDEMFEAPISRFQYLVVSPLFFAGIILLTVYYGIERHLGHVLA